MAYEIYVNHPETWDRREQSFAAWAFWAPSNAPWTGVGIDHMAEILRTACKDVSPETCRTLDKGGDLSPEDTRAVLRASEAAMGNDTRAVFQKAADSGYGVRVVFSKALGSAVSASAYLEKFGSA